MTRLLTIAIIFMAVCASATADQTAITFASTNDPAGIGPGVDNVRAGATVVAEAASWGRIKAVYRVR